MSAVLSIVILTLFAYSLSAAPQPAWEARHNFGLPSRNNEVVAMTLDNSGDIIIAGSQANANGDLDYAVLKYSQTGTQRWARTYSSGPQTNDQLRAMTVDSNGNVYLTGTSKTVKYNRDGVLQWIAPYAGRALAADSNEFVYVVGFQSHDFATVKLAPNGTNVWLRTHDRPFGSDVAEAVALGPAGEVYVGGSVVVAYDESGTYVLFALVKYDAAGNLLWVSPDFPAGGLAYGGEVRGLIALDSSRVYFGGNFVGRGGTYVTSQFDTEVGTNIWYYSRLGTEDGMTSMVVSASGEVYMTGRVSGETTLIYRTVALNTNGAQRWLADFGPTGTHHRANGIALDALGNVFVTGQAANSYFWPPPIFDFLTIKYDNSGHELWTKRYNGPANGHDIATSIAVTPDGGIFVAGTSANTNGGTDIILIKYVDLVNIQWLSKDAVLLQFPASPGQSVRFQASTNLTAWQDLATVSASPEGIARYTDTTVSQHPHRFYRLAVP
jgi:uncharacterized delta-60 repeat protein